MIDPYQAARQRIVQEHILPALARSGHPQSELALASGIHEATVSRTLRGKHGSMSVETLLAFCHALDLEPRSVMPTLEELRATDASVA